MNKVLFIAYQFPPMGGSGVQRSSKFVKYLRGFGWEPVVLTRKVNHMKLKDDSLLADIPQDLEIIRTGPWDATELPGIMSLAGKFISRKILIPDGERLWQLFSVRHAVSRINKGDIKLIYTTSYPYSDHILGLSLKRKFPEIPWVADFRDEWTNNPYLLDKPHYRLRMRIERRMERQVLANADQLITNTPVMMENFIKTAPDTKDKFCVIPNGYDSDDFAGIDTLGTGRNSGTGKNNQFTITYTGALYGRRKPDIFFEALSKLLKNKDIAADSIKVKLIGQFKTGQLNDKIEKAGLGLNVEVLPYMAHNECLAQLHSSDALLLLEGAGPGSNAFYTGKIFEYMKTGRPIIAIIPEAGAAAHLIRETSTGLVSDSSPVREDAADAAAANILYYYKAWSSGKMDEAYKPDRDAVAAYDRKNLTAKLAVLFDKLGGASHETD